MTDHPPGIVMLPVGAMTRYTAFWTCLFGLKVPPGSRIAMTQGASVAENQNIGARRMLENPDAHWAWIIGDDHTFQPDTVYHLLDRQLDFVSPLCAMRHPPFGPSVFKQGATPEDGWPPLTWDDIPTEDLLEVDATGLAGALVRRSVFEKIQDPWFEVGSPSNDRQRFGEDLYFCKKARQAGVRIWLDPTVQVGHMTTVVLDPIRTQGGWGIGLDLGSVVRLSVSFDELRKQIQIQDLARQRPH